LGNCTTPSFPDITTLAITTPMDFDSTPNGSIVGTAHYQRVIAICAVNVNDTIGARLVPTPGAKIVDWVSQKNYYYPDALYNGIYTTQELEARGLGYVPHVTMSFTAAIQCNNNNLVGYPIDFGPIYFQPPMTEQPIIWRTIENHCPAQPPTGHMIIITLNAPLQLVKIGNSSQHAVLPQNFTAPLLQASVYNQAAPATPVVSPVISWSIAGFASRVITRTCTTPSASESTLYLGTFNQQEIQALAPGATTPPREFTLTFTCPYMAYESISFFVEPMHGVYAPFFGAMNIAQGPGMAKGVGVYLEEYGLYETNAWWPVRYRSDTSPNFGFGAGTGKYLLSTVSRANSPFVIDPLPEPPRQQVVQFRASLIRLNEPVVAGQVKAAALIHIRYN